MKTFLSKVTQFFIDNNTQIFLSSILLFIATVSYTRYSEKEAKQQNKYSEMKFKLDSVSYEYYRLQNELTEDVAQRDSAWTAEQKLEK